jgi:hypothetical protein
MASDQNQLGVPARLPLIQTPGALPESCGTYGCGAFGCGTYGCGTFGCGTIGRATPINESFVTSRANSASVIPSVFSGRHGRTM